MSTADAATGAGDDNRPAVEPNFTLRHHEPP
jgi:hypothetical protein